MTRQFYLETERLTIRPLETTDYTSWLEAFLNRKPSQHKFDDGLLDMTMCTEEWFQRLVTHHQNLWKDDKIYILAIFDKDNYHLGMINIATLARGEMNWGEIGYVIHNQLWRKGIAYEAISTLLPYLKNTFNFHRIEANISPENNASKELIKKLGFQYECQRKNFLYEKGSWKDKDIFYLILHNDDLE